MGTGFLVVLGRGMREGCYEIYYEIFIVGLGVVCLNCGFIGLQGFR